MKLTPRILTLSTLLVLSGVADAHPLHAGAAMADGFLHPWLGWDHLLAMVAVGLWARQRQPGMAVAWLPAGFVAAVAVGAWAGHWRGDAAMVESWIALSLVGLGALLALRVRLSMPLALLLVPAMGLAHGWAHGVELPASAPGLPFAAGFVGATAVLHGIGVAIAAGVLSRGAAPLLRIGGIGILASGCGLLLG